MSRPRPRAIVRPPGDSFRRAESRHPRAGRIDPDRARSQHAAYCRLLVEAGVDLVPLPADEAYPDSCFTQDPVILLTGATLLARFGAPSRRGEEEDLAAVLAGLLGREAPALHTTPQPATLEGGDVLRLGRRLFVGRSGRTNEAGIAALARVATPLGYGVVATFVPDWALHLTTAVSAVGDHLLVGTQDALDQPAFEGIDRLVVPDDDRGAANVLAVAGTVITAGGHGVHRGLVARGFSVCPTDLSEFNLADGSPTCLSLLVEPR